MFPASQKVKEGEQAGVRKRFLSKKVLLCFKNVFRRKKTCEEAPGSLLRTHCLSKKVSEPSPLLCSPPLALPHCTCYTATENINIHRVFGSARNSRICINKRLRPPCTYQNSHACTYILYSVGPAVLEYV